MLGKTEGITDPMDMSLSNLWESMMTGKPGVLHFMGNRWGNRVRPYFLGAPKSLQMVTAAMKLKDAYSLEEEL